MSSYFEKLVIDLVLNQFLAQGWKIASLWPLVLMILFVDSAVFGDN